MTIHIDFDCDNTFWFNNDSIKRIISELVNNNSVTIKFNTEGPCAKTLGIYDFLESVADTLQVPYENIKIQTHNQTEFHRTFTIEKFPLAHSLPTVKNELTFQDNKHKKQFDHADFKKIACFVGRPSWDRLWISSQLYKNYKNSTIQTYHYNLQRKHQKSGIDQIIEKSKNVAVAHDAIKFLEKCPMHGPDKVDQYPITVDKFLDIDSEYNRLFAEISCETYIGGNAFFPTEKTWRPIALKTPFVVNGPIGFLKNLRKLGFKTFSKWWSEEYDDYACEFRIEKILEVIDFICNLRYSELNNMYNDMHYVLEHNKKILNNISDNDFSRIFKY